MENMFSFDIIVMNISCGEYILYALHSPLEGTEGSLGLFVSDNYIQLAVTPIFDGLTLS